MTTLTSLLLVVVCALLTLTIFIWLKPILIDPLVRLIHGYWRQPILMRLIISCFVAGFSIFGGAKNRPAATSQQRILSSVTLNDATILPADTNQVSFVQIARDIALSNLVFTLFVPEAAPVDIFGRVCLDSDGWEYRGTVNAFGPLAEASVNVSSDSYFLTAARADIDSDRDGIPDGRERFLFRTNPLAWDTSGDGLPDGVKVQLGLDPLHRDSDLDGYDDDEEIAAGQSPYDFTNGAGTTIRYYYDDDGRLVGGYIGNSQGASTVTLTPDGNPSALHERSAR